MANVLFCYPNVADGGSFYLTHGGSWLAALSLTNMQDARIAKRARSVDATTASTRFDIDLGSDTYFRAFGLIGHNLSQAATIRLELGNDSTLAATNCDSTALALNTVIYPPGVLITGDPGESDDKLPASEYALGYPLDHYHIFNSNGRAPPSDPGGHRPPVPDSLQSVQRPF